MSTPEPRERPETYHRYLDAAEAQFIRLGYEGATIRGISRQANAPLGTLHHYWGNKEQLFRDVCERRFTPILQEQLRRLRLTAAALEAGAGVGVARVVGDLVEPPLLAGSGGQAEQQALRLLYGRVLTEPSEVVKRIVKQMFREATALVVRLLRQCCAQLDEETFYWRFNCALGAFMFSQSFGDRVAYAADAPRGATDWSFVATQIVGFVSAGMLHPPVSP